MRKYLIVTADDFGVCYSINNASMEALLDGCVTSLTIMATGPYFKQAIQLARKNKIRHMGVHLTITSEFSNLRWGPVSPREDVPSLIDDNGFFHKTIDSFSKYAKFSEVKKELENQIKKVIENNIEPTHLDCHMFALHYEVCKRTAFSTIIKYLCKKYKLPFRSPFKREASFLRKNAVSVLSDSFKETYDIAASSKISYYNTILKNLHNAVSELILHCGYDNEELQHITRKSSRRQADFDYAISKKTAQVLKKNDITLITWEEAPQYL